MHTRYPLGTSEYIKVDKSLAYLIPAEVAPRPKYSMLKKMLLTQPPVKSIVLEMLSQKGKSPFKTLDKSIRVCNESGVTIGEMMDAALNSMSSSPCIGSIILEGGFVANAAAIEFAQAAGELRLEDDPTRRVRVHREGYEDESGAWAFTWKLPDGGFPFVGTTTCS